MRATTSTVGAAVAAGIALVAASGGIAWAATAGNDPMPAGIQQQLRDRDAARWDGAEWSGNGRSGHMRDGDTWDGDTWDGRAGAPFGMGGMTGMGGRMLGDDHGPGGAGGAFCDGDGDRVRDGSAWLEGLVGDDAVATATDQASLERMAQEERLARDLYLEFADAWGVRAFTMIASAEQHHLDAVGSLMNAYGLGDPTEGAERGVYEDAGLQALYDELIAQGSESVTGALAAAALVEETDIADLRTQDVDADAVATLYDRLEAASERHLTAFVSALDARGEAYEATVLDAAELADITGVPSP